MTHLSTERAPQGREAENGDSPLFEEVTDSPPSTCKLLAKRPSGVLICLSVHIALLPAPSLIWLGFSPACVCRPNGTDPKNIPSLGHYSQGILQLGSY